MVALRKKLTCLSGLSSQYNISSTSCIRHSCIFIIIYSVCVCARWVIDLNDTAFVIRSIENEDFHLDVTMANGNTILDLYRYISLCVCV